MSIETYGTEKRLRCAARLSVPYGIGRSLVLLPVPSSRDKINVTGTSIPLSEALGGVSADSLVVGYGLPLDYKEDILSRGADFLELSEDEEFLLDNARLTAIGALGYVLTSTDKAPEALSVGIVGFGRIGSELTRLFIYFGARVRVYTSKFNNRVVLGECGVDTAAAFPYARDASDFSGVDILINTAPMDMKELFVTGIPLGLRVIELASGNNFDGISGVERLPSLPEVMYPESAGAAYAAAIKRFLRKRASE